MNTKIYVVIYQYRDDRAYISAAFKSKERAEALAKDDWFMKVEEIEVQD